MFRAIFNAIYPLNCLSCNSALVTGENEFCLQCESGFPPLKFDSKNNNPISQLFWGQVDIHSATAVYNYIKSENLSQLIHAFKYNGNKNIGSLFSKILAYNFSEINDLHDVDVLTFVPMHNKKKRKRGYNQAEVLTEKLANSISKPSQKLIFRTENTVTQTEKDVFHRFENMDEKFKVNPSDEKYNHILIIDDVITTGATLIACAQLLKTHYNCKVSIYTLAYRDL